jgi:diguanylate cyclase (GGDEF)-like protein
MLRATWTAGSLRMWVFLGMALAVLPLLVSAILGYHLIYRGVMADFVDVAQRQRDQIVPAHRLQLDLADASGPLELYLDDSTPDELAAYRAARERIEAGFAGLQHALAREPDARALIERARTDWSRADEVAQDILSRRWPPGAANGLDLARRFDTTIAAATDRLAAATDDLQRDLASDHADAERAYERTEWIAGIAAGLSLLSMVAGVLTIGRLLRVSVDRLVDGATRFASGDRDHRIDVQVPPELHRVAEEFNHMILRIRDSEAALADLARRDRLTGLLNRRAYDEAIADALARRQRLNEDVSILLLDIDHFKRINDTHGHAAGDDVLRAIAATVTAQVRQIDKVCRIGGEEFVVILHDADRRAAAAMAERVRSAVEQNPVAIDAKPISVTVSIGVAIADDDGDAAALLARADAALYDAKQGGRNRVVTAREASAAARPTPTASTTH